MVWTFFNGCPRIQMSTQGFPEETPEGILQRNPAFPQGTTGRFLKVTFVVFPEKNPERFLKETLEGTSRGFSEESS